VKAIYILLSFIFFIVEAYSQQGGRYVYSFLNLSISAKQAALGGENYNGLNSDILQPLSNPAVLDSSMINKPALSYTSYLSSLNYGNIAYAVPIKKWGVFYAAILYMNYGKFQYADEYGNRGGTFGASESALLIGYAYSLPKIPLHVGVNLKYIHSSLEAYTSSGIAADIGFYYQKNGTEMGVSFRNIGTQLSTYNGHRESLPFEVDASFSRLLTHAPFKWHVTLENIQNPDIAFSNPAHTTEDPDGQEIEEKISVIDQFFRHVIIGAEIFPRKKFTFRLGYNFRRKAELAIKDQNFISNIDLGFGLRLKRFEINYAYAKYHYASNAHFFTATINLDEF
jgi:hypothetical protein